MMQNNGQVNARPIDDEKKHFIPYSTSNKNIPTVNIVNTAAVDTTNRPNMQATLSIRSNIQQMNMHPNMNQGYLVQQLYHRQQMNMTLAQQQYQQQMNNMRLLQQPVMQNYTPYPYNMQYHGRYNNAQNHLNVQYLASMNKYMSNTNLNNDEDDEK